MSNLKKCPFCNHAIDDHADDCYLRLYSVALMDSMFLGRRKMFAHVSCEELKRAWNRRAELPVAHASISPSIEMLKEHGVVVEHTCHRVDSLDAFGIDDGGERFDACSLCARKLYLEDEFCSGCGAKVVSP